MKCLDFGLLRTILFPPQWLEPKQRGRQIIRRKAPTKRDESEKIVCARAMQTHSALNLSEGFLGPGMATGSIVSKSGHGLVRDAHWANGPEATYIRCSNQKEDEERGGGRESIWLNRNSRGDIFKPGKVWCLVQTRGCARRASHKFTLSYHLIATMAAMPGSRRAYGARQKVGRNLAHEKSPRNYR